MEKREDPLCKKKAHEKAKIYKHCKGELPRLAYCHHSRSRNLILRHFLLFLVAILLTGCTEALLLVSPTSTIEGHKVTKATIRVNSPFTFRPALWTATYPAGLYVPQFEDKDGFYFKSQEQILGQTIGGGRTVLGGLYVSKTSWSVYKAYVDEGGAIYKFDIPFSVDFTVIRQQ